MNTKLYPILLYLQDTPEFAEEMFWIFSGTEMTILALAAIGCIGGFVQVQKLSHSFQKPYDLDQLLGIILIKFIKNDNSWSQSFQKL